MANITLQPIEGSAFERTVRLTEWEEDIEVERFRVAEELGCLAVAGPENELQQLIAFSDLKSDQSTMLPPTTVKEARLMWGPPEVGMFNTDYTSRGLGVCMANVPEGLKEPYRYFGSIGAYSIAVSPEEVLAGPVRNGWLMQKARYVRHGAVLVLASAWDKWTDTYDGTTKATQFMERNYGDAKVVTLPTPPSWVESQKRKAIAPLVEPRLILARGGPKRKGVKLPRVGSFRADDLNRIV